MCDEFSLIFMLYFVGKMYKYQDYNKEIDRLLGSTFSPPKQSSWPDFTRPRTSTPASAFTPVSKFRSLFSSPAESRNSPTCFLFDELSIHKRQLAPIAGLELSDALMSASAQFSPGKDSSRSRRDSAYGSADEISPPESPAISPRASPPAPSPLIVPPRPSPAFFPNLDSFKLFPDETNRTEFEENGIDSALDDIDREMRKRLDNKNVTSSTKGQRGRFRQVLFSHETTPEARERLIAILQSSQQSRTKRPKKKMMCTFCKNNGEDEQVYTDHDLKDDQKRIICPILSAYECPKCHATGANAHTIKYCPLTGSDYVDTRAVRNTARTAAGKRRNWNRR